MVAPIVGVLLTFADELLHLWIGAEFARESAPVAKWLALGVLINVIAQVPFAVLQGMGKARIVARLQLVQLPFYALALWYLTMTAGVHGAAIAWTARAAVDFVLLAIVADRVMPVDRLGRGSFPLHQAVIGGVALLAFWLTGAVFSSEIGFKSAMFAILFSLFSAWEWAFVLDAADRRSLISTVREMCRSVGGWVR